MEQMPSCLAMMVLATHDHIVPRWLTRLVAQGIAPSKAPVAAECKAIGIFPSFFGFEYYPHAEALRHG